MTGYEVAGDPGQEQASLAVDPTWTVDAAIRRHAAAALVLSVFGIDASRSRSLTLSDVARGARVHPGALVLAINSLIANPVGRIADAAAEPGPAGRGHEHVPDGAATAIRRER